MSLVEEVLKTRVREAGRVTFAEFMDTALYHPEGGYYTRPDRISARGDFYTSPVVHPAFGALLCVQLREMWSLLGRPAAFDCLEFGSGSGVLAADIQSYAARLDPDFARSIRYRGVDRARTAPGRERSSSGLAERGEANEGAVGCIVSNELLDAFPVHLFVVRSGGVRELYVHMSGDGFTMQEGEPSTAEIERRLSPYLPQLPEGFTGEVRRGVDEWARVASSYLTSGFVLTIDFGYDRDVLYSAARSRGTLRCYYRHTVTGDPLRLVGEQDMAAHVDFTEVDDALGRAGFAAIGHTSQREFLERLGATEFLSRLSQSVDTPADLVRNRAAILELVKPEGLGGFRAAIHCKGVEGDAGRKLTGLSGPRDAESDPLPVPLLAPDEDRVPVTEGRYPHATREFTATWEELFKE